MRKFAAILRLATSAPLVCCLLSSPLIHFTILPNGDADSCHRLDFWGPVSNFGIPVAAVLDITRKDPEM